MGQKIFLPFLDITGHSEHFSIPIVLYIVKKLSDSKLTLNEHFNVIFKAPNLHTNTNIKTNIWVAKCGRDSNI